MITEQDLREAIAECQGERNPGANTCIKLAAFFILKDHLFPDEKQEPDTEQPQGYSFAAAPPEPGGIQTDGDSEFLQAVNGRDVADIMPLMDELMTAVSVMNPRLYAGTMRRLKE